MKTITINPKQEEKKYRVEIYVAFYQDGGIPYVTARLEDEKFVPYLPENSNVTRYVFDIEEPTKAKEM